ncbi:MAG: hypothetical protein FIO02_08230 [Nitrosopumilales archaeon]|nr:hypothetical protein [Nitrosopumilales archaeon]
MTSQKSIVVIVIITRENTSYREDVVALIYRRKKNHRIAATTKKSKHPIFPFKKISIHNKVDILYRFAYSTNFCTRSYL